MCLQFFRIGSRFCLCDRYGVDIYLLLESLGGVRHNCIDNAAVVAAGEVAFLLPYSVPLHHSGD